jgi:xanthine/CO dehydrogenase XdhC/CoxF family maturation factor
VPSPEEELAVRVARGEEVVLATVIKIDGEPPSHTGAKILLSRTATLAGTLGCSEFDSAALADSAQIAEEGSPHQRTYRHELGSIDVYLEPYSAKPTLVVFAATPVSAALLRWAPRARISTAAGRDPFRALERRAMAGRHHLPR